jgi:hypothetical protein
MRVMSAEARESTIAAAIDVRGSQADSPRAPSVSINPSPVAIPAPAADNADTIPSTRRMMVLGNLLLIVGTILSYIIPIFRLSPGLVEAAVILVSIISVLSGVFLAIWAFVRPLLRRE